MLFFGLRECELNCVQMDYLNSITPFLSKRVKKKIGKGGCDKIVSETSCKPPVIFLHKEGVLINRHKFSGIHIYL